MMLRMLRYAIPVKKGSIQFTISYSIVAYDIRTTQQGRVIYYKHHIVEDGLSWDQVVEKGYEDIPKGTLHNRSVAAEVSARLG